MIVAGETVNTKAALVVVLVIGCAVTGFTGLNSLKGPFSRCEGYGGQMFVGPGGETSCVSGRTFLPVEGFESAPR